MYNITIIIMIIIIYPHQEMRIKSRNTVHSSRALTAVQLCMAVYRVTRSTIAVFVDYFSEPEGFCFALKLNNFLSQQKHA